MVFRSAGFAFLVVALACAAAGSQALQLGTIKLPPGFSIALFATDVPSARQMALGSGGTVFVGSMEGRVYALVDRNRDGRSDRTFTIASGLTMPSGVAFREGALYVGAVNRVLRFDDVEAHLQNPPDPVTVIDSLPRDRHHGWKFIGFGPDGLLYVPVGGPCNICERDDQRYASILRMKPDGSGLEVFASGIRNAVGFDWHPTTRELWFTDNGRDNLGDNRPPDELNLAPRPGLHFGFPYCHGGDIPDPELGGRRPCSDFTPPVQKLGPHVAAIGMRFYTGSMFPAEYRNQVFIAEHGSWNRSIPIGYRVSVVWLEGDRAIKYEPFAEGWLRGADAWGRPADVLVMPDGALLVSDDETGTVYRITYGPRS